MSALIYFIFFSLNVLVVATGMKFMSVYKPASDQDLDLLAYVRFSVWANAGLAALWVTLALLGN